MPNLYPTYKFYLNGNLVNPPEDWLDLEILATFENNSPEANITTGSLSFVNEEAVLIRNWIRNGLTGGVGIFEGMPFKIQILNTNNIYDSFEGYLDLTDEYSEITPVRVTCKIKKTAGIISFTDRVDGLTFNYLRELGIFNASDYYDVKYVLEKQTTFLELALLSISTFLLAKELADTIRRLSSDIAIITALTATGITGPVSALVYAIAIAIINLVYAILLVIYIIQMIKEIVSYLINPTRIHKGITFRTALTKACNYLGYQFSSSITDMDNVYLPSKSKRGILDISQFNPPLQQFFGAFGNGLPSTADFGYTVGEMFKLVNMMFYSRITIRTVNGQETVFVEPLKNDSFWIPTAGYTLPDILDEQISYNTQELKANRLITFQLDVNDGWTLDNYRGNSYEITTDAVVIANQKFKNIKGLDETRIPLALPTRKSGLTELENAILQLCLLADGVVNFFGGNSNLSSYITNRVGMLKVTDDLIQVPKVIKYSGGTLATNYRDLWGAKYLEENYHYKKSFVRNNYDNQYRIFTEREIPFGFSGFLSLLNYGACPTSNGSTAEIESIKWVVSSDKAIANYRVKEIYTKNLTERFREEGDNYEGSI
jgi:hypothetical protein